MKDFRDFVKTTYAGLMEVEGLNESKSFIGRDAKKAMFSHPEISKAFSKENAAIYPASSPEIKRLGKNHAIVSATNQDSAHSDTTHGIRYHVTHDDSGNPTGHSVHLYTHTYPIVVEHGKHIQGGVAEGNGEGQSLEDAFKKAKSSYEKHYEKSATKPKAKMKFD